MSQPFLDNAFLVNILGHSAGVVLFGIFLYLLVQDRAARRLTGSWKSILAATLALAWNAVSLFVLGLGTEQAVMAGWMAAAAFSVLSLLPAVLFDLSVSRRDRLLVGVGYGLSATAIGLHLLELLRVDAFQGGERFHSWGLMLISAGFGGLTVAAAILPALRRGEADRAGTSRLVATMSLFLLAISFVHFGDGHPTQFWSQELAFHHAAIPLALMILLQDYRFVLLDAFLRFLANVALAALFTAALFQVRRSAAWPVGASGDALELVLVSLAFVLFALLRGRVQVLLTKAIFRTPDLEKVLRELPQTFQEEGEYLRNAAQMIGGAMGAEAVIAEAGSAQNDALTQMDLRQPLILSELPRNPRALEQIQTALRDTEAVVPFRLPAGTTFYLFLGRRAGGKRYLSEDLRALSRAAGIVVEQIERFRELETRRLVAQAELRALQSQIHPHFLFNALNALYGIIPREAKGARETVLNLADIFRYFLETRKSYLPLEEELHIVRAYLAVEKLRLGAKLNVEIDVDPEALGVEIPVLALQPLVENAVKHGIAPNPEGGRVRVEVRLERATNEAPGQVRVSVADTGAGFTEGAVKPGVGLENVRRRLELCYGSGARLEIEAGERGFHVAFRIPAKVGEAAIAGAMR
ncbi:MAG: histidine kinase [Bryobacteraceae bacterium]